MEFRLMTYQIRRMIMNEMGIGIYKNPWCDQYVCNQGYHFVYNGCNLGRIIWVPGNNIEGYYTEKDEED